MVRVIGAQSLTCSPFQSNHEQDVPPWKVVDSVTVTGVQASAPSTMNSATGMGTTSTTTAAETEGHGTGADTE